MTTEKTTVADLQREIEQLRVALSRLTGGNGRREPEEQTDYVAFGSDEHAAMLGLRKATEEDGDLVIDGWSLEGITNYPPNTTKEWLLNHLRQKINELTAPIPTTQSVDPRLPNWAPTMWDPRQGRPFRETTK